MKRIFGRAWVVLLLLCAFAAGMCLFTGDYFSHAARWVAFPANRHIYTDGRLTSAGEILDRSGVVLAHTLDGKRLYNENAQIRRATLHAVGDPDGNISTGAQLAFSSKLTGYDFLNGTYSAAAAGNDLTLTLDADVCTAAYKALSGRAGAAGAYNYKTGELICMVSAPSFDPLDPPDLSRDTAGKYAGMYVNRFVSSVFTPGSVFKLVTSAAAIDTLADIEEQQFSCTGSLKIGEETITCPKAHGKIGFQQALASSCNVAFAQIARQLGAQALTQYAEKAGIGASYSVDGIRSAAGSFDLTGANDAQLAWAGIGQHTDLVNPLEFMVYMGAIANRGVPVNPRIIKALTSPLGFPLHLSLPSSGQRMLSEATAAALADMMKNNVKETYGTNNYPGLDLYAKSGTAEVGKDKKPHAWFAGFIRNDACPLAFVVVVENGGSGSAVAGPVANKMLQAAVRALSD